MIRRFVLGMVMTTFVLASETSAQAQVAADTAKLEARVESLEKQVQLVHRRVASLEAELQRPVVYKALKLTNVREVGGPYSVGDNVTIGYSLTNRSEKELSVPLDRSFSRPSRVVGVVQHWIERHGKEKVIPGTPPQVGRQGGRYAAGGRSVLTKATIAAGESITLQHRLSTAGYPAGKYTCYIEYHKVLGGVSQTKELVFELRK